MKGEKIKVILDYFFQQSAERKTYQKSSSTWFIGTYRRLVSDLVASQLIFVDWAMSTNSANQIEEMVHRVGKSFGDDRCGRMTINYRSAVYIRIGWRYRHAASPWNPGGTFTWRLEFSWQVQAMTQRAAGKYNSPTSRLHCASPDLDWAPLAENIYAI